MSNPLCYSGTSLENQALTTRNLGPPNPRILRLQSTFVPPHPPHLAAAKTCPPQTAKSKSYSTTHFSFMMLALKPSTANTTRVASTDVKKLMKETRVASKWQLLSCLL